MIEVNSDINVWNASLRIKMSAQWINDYLRVIYTSLNKSYEDDDWLLFGP